MSVALQMVFTNNEEKLFCVHHSIKKISSYMIQACRNHDKTIIRAVVYAERPPL
jgi:hypothetical protein